MSIRLPLIALAGLTLAACDGGLPRPGGAAPVACCCDQCPTTAAPATPTPAAVSDRSGGVTRVADRTRKTWRASGGSGGYRYQRSGESRYGARYGGGYGGRYGAGGQVYGGVSVSVEETQTASERYSYSESSSGYGYSSASGGGYGYGYSDGSGGGYGGQGQGGHPYPPAGVDQNGYLTWPGKVEN
ncbi:MAG: hypothetical protein Q8L66_06470 [Caulobacter sp.]|nr:hypothetical protein [Caulobacter sp.]